MVFPWRNAMFLPWHTAVRRFAIGSPPLREEAQLINGEVAPARRPLDLRYVPGWACQHNIRWPRSEATGK